ncbi:MAG: hypothetical protein JST83_05740 [Bacteroidetes bacterium]|nr:hypothetical protein [Bacteroidota bacterium]
MDSYLLQHLVAKIKSDKDYLNNRRVLHENYEWLEGFWRYRYNKGNSSIDNFITDTCHYYWATDEIKQLAREFASIECVGSNCEPDYTQNHEIAKATMYLRYYCNLFTDHIPVCNGLCRHHKIATAKCSQAQGQLWCRLNNDNKAAFKALMYIIRQIRNNLFHGHKMTLEQNQFNRDKILVALAARTTSFLFESLEHAVV